MSRKFFILWLLFLSLAFAGKAAAQSTPPPVTPPVAMPPLPQGLEPPPTVYPPTQVSLGSQVYYQVCMACHGDHGQGLTDAWRGQLDPPDQDCWQSGCHNPRHPPGGFVFPKAVPPVVGPGFVASFGTAQDVHDFIRSKMPFQAPGSLSEEEYWQLTAFLLSANGIDPGTELDVQRAAQVAVRPKPVETPSPASHLNPANYWPIGAAIFAFLGLCFYLVKWRGGLRPKDTDF